MVTKEAPYFSNFQNSSLTVRCIWVPYPEHPVLGGGGPYLSAEGTTSVILSLANGET